jgi:hypothetical protein
VAAENWQLLEDFRFTPDSVANRVTAALPSLAALALWFAALAVGALWSSARMKL